MRRSILTNIITSLTLALLLLARADIAVAQDNAFQRITVQVTLNKGGKEDFQTVQYAKFKTFRQAKNAESELKVAIAKMDQLGAVGNELDKAVAKLKINWQISAPNGLFSTSVMPGQGILVLAESSVPYAFETKEGKTEYKEVIKLEHQLRNVDVLGINRRKGPNIPKTPSIDNGYEARFDVALDLPDGYTTDDSRLIIQPMAIDCQTDDTVAWLRPFIFESNRYHRLQDRRMAFDYTKNDAVALGYIEQPVLKSNTPFIFHDRVTFRKPDKDKIYRGAYTCVLEDYHHVIWDGGEESGSCLAFRPMKFLDFSVAAAEMPLTSEFQETAEANLAKFERDLRLKFEVGKDVLLHDSLNQVELNKLVRELRSYGERLWYVRVQGGASPEGSLELNTNLANKRADKARALLRNSLQSDVRVTTLEPRVYTWDDVLAEVEKQGKPEITEMVRNTIANNKPNEVFGILKGLPFFETTITPILENQRIMRCSYAYELEHVMEADEAVAAYYSDKEAYMNGTKRLSNGDYYNLLANIKDSAELDVVTQLAYKHITSQPGYTKIKLAPYVANRMALINIRRGTPNLDILRPFIDYTIHNVNQKRRIDDFNSIVINRKEILINQAVNYFQEQKLDTAMYILGWVPQSPQTERLRMYITFSKYYVSYICNDIKDPDTLALIKQAEGYVLHSSPENQAIIYAELHSHLDKKRSEVEPLVDRMSDDNPKKWYLKGILWSEEAGKEPAVEGADDGFKELTDMEIMTLQNSDPTKLQAYYEAQEKHNAALSEARKDNTPYFLAYFQHSFDLEPKYKRLFYNEGNVSDAIRKKYPYKSKDKEAYRKKFKLLKAQADRLKAVEAQAATTAAETPAAETTSDNGAANTPANDNQ